MSPALSARPRATKLADFAYVRLLDQFFDLEARKLVSRASFERRFRNTAGGWQNATAAFLNQEANDRCVVDGVSYRLGEALFLDEVYGRCVNLAPSPTDPIPEEPIPPEYVLPWLTHVRRCFPAPDDFSEVVCWMAWVVQNLELKPQRHLILGGDAGLGKLLLLPPLMAAVGQDNLAVLRASLGALRRPKKLLFVENLVEPTIDDIGGTFLGPGTAPLLMHRRGARPHLCPDTTALVGLTSCRASAARLAEDPRFIVAWSSTCCVDDPGAAELEHWCETGGAELAAGWLRSLNLGDCNMDGLIETIAGYPAREGAGQPPVDAEALLARFFRTPGRAAKPDPARRHDLGSDESE